MKPPIVYRPIVLATVFAVAALAGVSSLHLATAAPALAMPADSGTYLVYTGGVGGQLGPCG